jgi:nucleoside-diphosphate-sugar epimerase
MRIGVTGSSGFIGKSLCDQLINRQYYVNATVRKSNKIFMKPHKNLKIFEIENIPSENNSFKDFLKNDCIVHCAARAHVMKETEKDSLAAYRKVNVEGTKNLAEQAVAFGVKRFIFLSSVKVNGEQTIGSASFQHNDISRPEDAYGISKWEAEQELWKISKRTGLEVVIIRSPLVYGEGLKGNFLRLLDLVYKEVPLPFLKVENSRSFIGLDNLIHLIALCINHPKAPGETFLISDGEDISTPELIRKLTRAMEKSSRLFPASVSLIKLISYLIGKSSEAKRILGSLRVDSSRARKVLGWSPPFSLDEGLKKTVQWYLKQR